MQLLCILFMLALPLTVLAETKTTTAEATYIMGEGETPTTAESKALNAAKQKAVEQLLPFVEEQTKRNQHAFTSQQIRSMTEAILETEVLEKKRTVVGERFQFTAKIKATLQQDRILAEVAEREKRLLAEKLTKDGDQVLQQLLAEALARDGNQVLPKTNSPKYEKALEFFNRAIETDPTFPAAYVGRYSVYSSHLPQMDKALEDITEAIRLEPIARKQGEYYVIRARTYKTLGDNKRALADYSEAVLRNPQAEFLWERGQLLSDLGQYEKAILDYSRILQIELSKDEKRYREFALNGRASAYVYLKQYDHALADYAELIRLTNGKKGYDGRGLAYMELGEYRKAASDFTEEINQRSKAASGETATESSWTNEIFHGRALAYFQLGEHEKVIPDITEYLHHESVSTKDRSEAYALRGRAYGATDNNDKALADYTEAIRADPQMASAYYRRGMTYVFMRVWDRATSDLTEALRLHHMDSVDSRVKLEEHDLVLAYTYRGGAHLNLNHLDQSLSDLNEALRRNPKEMQALFWRGLAHGEQKDTDAARRDLQQACQLGHDKACEAVQSIR